MNERIQKLAEQAWDATAVSPKFGHPVSFAEKFAELIVRECAEVASCNGHVSGFTLGDLIKQHFGVE
jgi:hypothetical protein